MCVSLTSRPSCPMARPRRPRSRLSTFKPFARTFVQRLSPTQPASQPTPALCCTASKFLGRDELGPGCTTVSLTCSRLAKGDRPCRSPRAHRAHWCSISSSGALGASYERKDGCVALRACAPCEVRRRPRVSIRPSWPPLDGRMAYGPPSPWSHSGRKVAGEVCYATVGRNVLATAAGGSSRRW